MPVALSGQAELSTYTSNTAKNQLGLGNFNQASPLPSGIHSSLNPLFGESDFQELEVSPSRQAPLASSLNANPVYNNAASKVNLASSSPKALPSYYVHPLSITNQVRRAQGA